MPSPTRRALHSLRQSFQHVCIVEYWQSFAKKRKDAFGCLDILVIGTNQIIGVQCTSMSNHNARREKILKSVPMKAWARANQGIWIMSYGKKKGRWEERLEMISIGDFP